MRIPIPTYSTPCPTHRMFNVECHNCVVMTLVRMGREIDELKSDLHKELTEAKRGRRTEIMKRSAY